MYDGTGLRVVRDEIEADRDPGCCLFHLALCRRTRALSNIPFRLILDRHPLLLRPMASLSMPSPAFRNDAPTLMRWLRNSCLFPLSLPYNLQGTGIASIGCLASIHPPPSYLETHMLKRLRQPITAIMCSWPSCSISASLGPFSTAPFRQLT